MIILSDLSDVLIGGLDDTAMLVYRTFGEGAGRKCWQRFYKTEEDFNNLMRGKMTEKEYYDIFFANDDLPFKAEHIAHFFSESFKHSIFGTLDIYQRIEGYQVLFPTYFEIHKGRPDIYIVSDHIAERIDEIKGYHPEIFSLTKGEFWSSELGKIKRDPGFFQELLEKLGVDAKEVIFIDDNPINIRAAEQVGIKGITFESADLLEARLKDLGLLIQEKA